MNQRFIIIVFIFLNSIFTAKSEVQNHVKWSVKVERAGNDVYNLKIQANIDPKWHMYSQHIPDGGPVATSFDFVPDNKYSLVGKTEELSKPEEVFDKSFEMKILYFTKEAIFVQKIKLKGKGNFTLKAVVTYMSCDDHTCLPPRDEDLNIPISDVIASQEIKNTTKVDTTKLHSVAPVQQIIPSKTTPEFITKQQDSIKTTAKQAGLAQKTESSFSFWQFFLIAFGAGLLGMLTPCVYPMIPMTVSFFMRGEEKKSAGIFKAFFFGLSIIFIYTMIGVVVALTRSGADITSVISTHWIPNLIFFLIFLTFAASFFGLFEIVLPSSLTNKIDQQADKGGFLGVFFMALTLVVVSFSCTGPIVGSILVEASKGFFLKPVVGMFGFSLAFAIPFAFFAVSPSLLKKLAKSGSWLNSVKVFMAFILLAFSLKYLSSIDSSYHFNFLTRDIYLAIWIVIFTLLGLYLAGKIKFEHDSELKYISIPRLFLIIITFSFVVYMIPGMFGAPLKALSSLLPAQENSFSLSSNQTLPVSSNLCETPRFNDFLHMPPGYQGYFDFEQGLACARKLNKPVFLDLKGHSCSNCKVMEAEVFSDASVKEKLTSDFVIIALYTDDKYELPEKEWVKSTQDGKIKKTMGAKNLDLEITKFDTNTLPLYVILKPDGSFLAKSDFNTNKQAFLNFLTEGKDKFSK